MSFIINDNILSEKDKSKPADQTGITYYNERIDENELDKNNTSSNRDD